jgi:hypothetical protein
VHWPFTAIFLGYRLPGNRPISAPAPHCPRADVSLVAHARNNPRGESRTPIVGASFPETRRTIGFRLVSGRHVKRLNAEARRLTQTSGCGWAGRTEDVDHVDDSLRNSCFASAWCSRRLWYLPRLLPPDGRSLRRSGSYRSRSYPRQGRALSSPRISRTDRATAAPQTPADSPSSAATAVAPGKSAPASSPHWATADLPWLGSPYSGCCPEASGW